jgi:hypothetical protein
VDATHNISVAKVTAADYRRWKTRGLDARTVFVRGLDALDADEHAAPDVPDSRAWFALVDRLVTALEWRPEPRTRPAPATAPRQPRATLDAAWCHRQLVAAGLHQRERVTRLDVQGPTGWGQKRTDRIMGIVTAAGLATAHPVIAPLPRTWTVHPPAPGTSPPGTGT